MVRSELRNVDAELLVHLVKVLDHRTPLDVLELFEAWNAAQPVPLERRWPGKR